MFLKNYQLFFFFFLATGTVVAISANSWFTCWVGLEINLMSMIPLILRELNFKSTEASIRYFLPQAIASVLLIAAACAQALGPGEYILGSTNAVIVIALAVKAGLAPFHLWFPQVIQCLSWFKRSIILVWQKIAPFILIACFYSKFIIYLLIIISSIVGALGGLNQLKLKLILTYSSIAHSAWILIIVNLSLLIWRIYFLIYATILGPIIIFFYLINLNRISEINKTKINYYEKILLAISIISLGGLPPFLGFTAKLAAITLRIKTLPIIILLILISSSLVSLFFYTKMFYRATTGASIENKINFLRKKNIVKKILLIPIAGNIIIPLIILLI